MSPAVPTRHLLTVREVAARLGVNERTVRRRIRSGGLPAVRLGGPRSALRIDANELAAWLYGDPGEAA